MSEHVNAIYSLKNCGRLWPRTVSVRPMLGFKVFRCARILIAGIETMHMIRKGQIDCMKDKSSGATFSCAR